MTTFEYIVIAALVVVIVGAIAIATVISRRKTRAGAPLIPPVSEPISSDFEAPDGERLPGEPGGPEPPAQEPAPALESAGVVEPAQAELEVPAPAAGRMQRLRERLAASGALGKTILSIFSRGNLSEADWEEIEDTLLMADLGVAPTVELMEKLRVRASVLSTSDPQQIREALHEELLAMLLPQMSRELNLEPVSDGGPASVLVVGVNGTGKTTTVGKLARVLVAQDKKVVLGAADTFRAAAAEQLTTWGQRVGVEVVKSEREGADPASVAYDAVDKGIKDSCDVVLVDTAGRLQNKAGLMDELGKIKRVMSKHGPISETLLVIDATTGQNGMRQAQVFAEAADITGIVLTKLDGTAKGGIVVTVQRELGVPVKYVGLGEGPDDLAAFDPEIFAQALLS